jgi:hypothetical protein
MYRGGNVHVNNRSAFSVKCVVAFTPDLHFSIIGQFDEWLSAVLRHSLDEMLYSKENVSELVDSKTADRRVRKHAFCDFMGGTPIAEPNY